MSANQCQLRMATSSDASSINLGLSSLAADLGYANHYHGTTESILAHAFSEPQHFQVALAESDGHLAGLAVIFPYYSTMRAQAGVYIQDLWVAPNFRNKQIGQQLLTFVAQQGAARWGAVFMMLAAHNDNQAAQRFYQRLGFSTQYEDQNMVLEPVAFTRMVEGGSS